MSDTGGAIVSNRILSKWSSLSGANLTIESLEPRTLLSAGDLDPTFGVGGRVVNDVGAPSSIHELALQSDDAILALGYGAMVRCSPDGSLDPSFGTGGRLATNGFDFAVLPDDRIIILSNGFTLARYQPDGQPDPTFGENGVVTGAIEGDARTLALDADGKILVGGGTQSTEPHTWAFEWRDSLLVRFDPDGTLDPSFGDGGVVRTTFGGDLYDLAVRPNGGIVAVGDSPTPLHGLPGLTISLYPADGNPPHVSVYPEFEHGLTARAVALQDNGKFVAAGFTGIDTRILDGFEENGDPYFGASSPDMEWGMGQWYDVALQPDGKILVAGAGQVDVYSYDYLVARYDRDGNIDRSFGTNGISMIDMGSGAEAAEAIIVLADGKILVGGSANGDAFGLIRLQGDRTTPPPPQVAGFLVASSTWTPPFISELRALGLGDGGVMLPGDAATPALLPWSMLDQLKIRFNGTASAEQAAASLRGTGVAAYTLGTFDFDATTYTATWTLPSPLMQDRLEVRLGDSRGYFNVLPGDVNRDGRVNAQDLGAVKSRLNKTAADTTAGPASYSVFADVNADGRINAQDLALVKQRLNSRLPDAPAQPEVAPAPAQPEVAPAPAPASTSMAAPSAARDLFGSAPILD